MTTANSNHAPDCPCGRCRTSTSVTDVIQTLVGGNEGPDFDELEDADEGIVVGAMPDCEQPKPWIADGPYVPIEWDEAESCWVIPLDIGEPEALPDKSAPTVVEDLLSWPEAEAYLNTTWPFWRMLPGYPLPTFLDGEGRWFARSDLDKWAAAYDPFAGQEELRY